MRPSEQNMWLPWDLQRKVPEGPALGWRAGKLPWGGDIRREGRAPVSLVCTNTWISISPRQWQAASDCGMKWVTPAHCLQWCPVGQHVCSRLGLLGGPCIISMYPRFGRLPEGAVVCGGPTGEGQVWPLECCEWGSVGMCHGGDSWGLHCCHHGRKSHFLIGPLVWIQILLGL